MRQKFINLITLKGFAKSTIKNYLSLYDQVIKEDADIFSKGEDEIIGFLADKINKSNCSQAYVSQFTSVFNIVIRDILKRDEKIKIPRIKRPQKQPEILSLDEVSKLLNAIKNDKQRAIVALMYSTGLRVSEACGIKITDIDTNNGFISIRNAKGGIDRKVMLDSKILDILRKYYLEYKPSDYLFNGAKGHDYSPRSVQQIITKAAKDAGIKKNISSHSMRHSCFTQLLRNGVDIRSIQKLAGHKQISTTARYLQIVDSDVLSIISPIQGVKI
jgi:integrase/recombinase XerD